MNKRQHQVWPDGTEVVFTQEAKDAMHPHPGITRPLRSPAQGADQTYTIDNTDDSLHDVILRETGERYGTYWLQAAHPPIRYIQPMLPIFDSDPRFQGEAVR